MLENVSIMTGLWVIEMGGKRTGFIRNVKRIERAFRENGSMTTPEIYETLVNQTGSNGRPYRHTVTMNQLVNLLSKNKQFKKCESNGMTTTLKTGPDN